jgi:hypothetical protein
MSRDLETSVIVNLGGDLEKRAARYEQSIRDFSKKGARHMGGLRRVVGGVDRALVRMGNRYIALGTGASVGIAIKGTADLSARLNQLGIDAGFNGDKLLVFKEKSKKAIKQAALEYGVQSEQIIAGIENIVQKTGDIKFATDNMNNLALAISATGGEGFDFGGIFAELAKMGEAAPSDVLGILDSLVSQGQQGAFVLKDVASLGERIFAAYGPGNRQEILEMGAALQTIRKSMGTSEQAVTSFERLMDVLRDTEKVKQLAKAGVRLFDKGRLEDYRKGLKPLSEALLPITDIMRSVAEVTKGDSFLLSGIIDESIARKGFAGLLQEYRDTQKSTSLDKLLNVSGTGDEILKDAADNAREFNAQMMRLNESWKTFADNNLAGPVADIAEQLNNLDSDRIQEILETTKKWAIAIGGVVVAYKLARGVMGTVKDFKGAFGKQGGGSALGNVVGSLKPIPVYVVNAPGLGAGGRKGKGLSGAFGKASKATSNAGKISKASKIGQVAGKVTALGTAAVTNPYVLGGTAAFAGGYGIGTLINKKLIEGSSIQLKVLDAMTNLLAALGNDNAQLFQSQNGTIIGGDTTGQSASAMQGKLDIEVEVRDNRSPRVSIKNIESTGLDIEAGGSMVGL